MENPLTVYVVYLCGCTDCHPHAAFMDESAAVDWAKHHEIQNPEGYLIQKERWWPLTRLEN